MRWEQVYGMRCGLFPPLVYEFFLSSFVLIAVELSTVQYD